MKMKEWRLFYLNKRKVYLDNYDLNQAIDLYLNDLKDKIELKTELVKATDALNMISSEAVYAKVSSPNYNASAMDGIMVVAAKTVSASESTPLILSKDQYQYVDTGDVISPEFDAVVMIENVIFDGDKAMLVKPVSYFENIRPIGEDITQTQMIIPSFHQIQAVDMGPLMASQNEYIKVFSKLKVAIIPTGSEIVDVSTKKLEDGMIIDSNSSMIRSLANNLGLETKVYQIIKDEYELLKTTIKQAALECDIVLINAGSSAGSEDYTVKVIEELGHVSLHGIAIKPGKPAILGTIDQAMVIGLPGYPVSTYIVFEQVFKPVLLKLLHQKTYQEKISAKATKTAYSSLKHLEFVRVKVGYVNNEFVATPLARGAGISMSLAEADGMVVVVKESEGFKQGDQVEVVLFKPLEKLKNQITIIGSHDLILDVMQDCVNQLDYAYPLSSSHVGSYAGLIALKNNECDLASTHILAEDGTYNIKIIQEIFKDEKMILIKGVKRRQVLGLLKGNPKQIKGISDLARADVKYVNRQKGSGTAILLDSLLKANKINPQDVNGYNFIMPSHFNVGAAIVNKTADAGILIKSIADIMNLDYIELMSEEYDFVIRAKDFNTPKIQAFISLLNSDLFKDSLSQFDSYDTSLSGKIIEV